MVKLGEQTRKKTSGDEAGVALSELEIGDHGAKVKRGQLSAVQQGRYGTGPAPYGYRRGREGERPLEIDDREAEVVRTIFREYLRTRSTGKVVQVVYAKPRPANFEQAISIVAIGRYDQSKGVFVADDMLVKCPSKYQEQMDQTQA